MLLLGSMTAVAGLVKHQYYAHPQNCFWRILGGLFEDDTYALRPYESRIEELLRRGVCLWNVLATCERKGSLDAAIRKPVANDIASLIARFPSLRVIGLNGQWAHDYFLKTVCRQQPALQRAIDEGRLRVVRLISSSPACAMPNAVQEKTRRWKKALQSDLSRAVTTS